MYLSQAINVPPLLATHRFRSSLSVMDAVVSLGVPIIL